MHGVSPPISKNRAFRILIAGAPGDGCSTLSAQLKDAAVATVSRAIDAGTSGDAGSLGHAHSFAMGQRAFIFERLIGVAPSNETTGACDYEIAVIVVDAQRGLTPETKRQIVIASTLGVRHIVIAVNKLDLIGWDRKAYESVAAAFVTFAANLRFTSELPIPVSAILGDNIAAASAHMPWYKGPSLISYLERTNFDPGRSKGPLRLPIDAVLRPDSDHRRYRGTIASGQLHRGDKAQVAVSGVTSTIERIYFDQIESEMAHAGESVSIELSSHIDVGRGDMLVHPAQRPHIADQFAAQALWMSSEPLLPGRDYTLKVGTKELTASVTAIKYRLDFETLHQEAARTLQQGEVGACTIAAAEPLALDAFGEVPQTGRFTLHDRYAGREIAAGTIDFILRRGENIHPHPLAVSKKKRALLKAQKPCILWFTGLSGAGKSTIANLVEAQLARRGSHTYLLDGDNVRHGLNKNLGFTTADRVENIRRVGEVAKLFVDAGLIVLCSFISPFRAERETVRGLVEPAEFLEIFVRAPLAECERRDPKGLYAKSRAGELPNFTGIDSPYEEPENPDLVLDTTSAPAAELARRLVALLESRELIVATPSIG